jgi:integrator complex subunit 1
VISKFKLQNLGIKLFLTFSHFYNESVELTPLFLSSLLDDRKQATTSSDDQGNDVSGGGGGDDDNVACLPLEKIPAMAAVVQDEMLFAALIRCLKVVPITSSTSSSSLAATTAGVIADEDSTAGTAGTKNASMSAAAAAVASVILNRKRSLSLTNNELSATASSSGKAMKLGGHHTHHSNHHHNYHSNHHHHHHHHLSPVPSSRGKLNATNEQQKQRANQNSNNASLCPTMNVAVLAATILYMAMAHLDHWPVPLIQAYAEDCFGPRLWVDEEQCRPLVENLALVHTPAAATTTATADDIVSDGGEKDETASSRAKGETCSKEDEKTQKDSALVAEAYRDFHRVLLASVEENNRIDHSNGSAAVAVLGDQNDAIAAPQQFALPFRSSSGGRQKMGLLPKRRSSISSSGSYSSNMERSMSIDTMDPTGRAQVPYEKDSDSVGDEEDEERVIEMSKDASKKLMKGASPDSSSKKKKSTPQKRLQRDGDSSSSGEDDNEVVMSEANDQKDSSSKIAASSSNNKSALSALSGMAKKQKTENSTSKGSSFYPIVQTRLDLRRKRPRYVGANLEAAHEAIGVALSARIGQKTKHNSGLLQTLPSFTSVPAVRGRVAPNLEKWLQSPALAGLARALFADTVDKMKNVDPPLKHDLAAIDCILAMKLKANQLSAHVGNVTAIAKRIPTPSVATHIYSTLFRDQLVLLSSDPTLVSSSMSDTLKMVAAAHQALPSQVSFDAMGAALLMLLADSHKKSDNVINAVTTRRERDRLIKNVRLIIRSLSAELGWSLDGFALLRALLSHDVSDKSWSIRDDEDKARLMFQCVTLHVSMIAKGALSSGPRKAGFLTNNKPTTTAASPAKKEEIRKAMYTMRKLLLSWCCTDYVPRISSKQRTRAAENDGSVNTLAGAGSPDYKSALNSRLTDESIPSWLNTVRCLLLIEDANSDLMSKFLAPVQSTTLEEESDWKEELERIKLCCDHGADIDDEMIWIVLRSAAADGESDGMLASMALQLLEHLFESCGKARGAALRVEDPDLVWELYTLAQYSPPRDLLSRSVADDDDEDDDDSQSGQNNGRRNRTIPGMRRLAYPGYWWRVTMLALVMCGASPEKIGSMVWNEHPTLRSLMKMVTAARYRFPTVDCDDQRRDDIKQKEQAARDEETRIAELLFLPPRRKKNDSSGNKGSRVSRRLMKQQLEKEAAAEHAETNKRKKMMRAAQKSIMLWDPDGPARKPPRESADLLLSVEEMFGLSAAFQGCTKPDLLLLTIGQTTRGAIERAYDWLIPIISQLPTTIARLPSNASCFLLLRAYGADGDERLQLRELSAPLLRHVKESLRGKFGESDCLKAFDLLMSDVASHNPDRRKSARRVLRDSLGHLDEAFPTNADATQQQPVQPSAWMTNILLVQHAKEVVPNAIKYMSTAAKFERGRVLRSLVLALQKHLSFAAENSVEVSLRFPDLLTQLISQRPSVYAEAIDRFPDFRSVVIVIIHTEFSRYAESGDDCTETSGGREVIMKLRWSSQEEKEVGLPLALLQSTCALLSIWTTLKTGNADDSNLIQTLVVALMRSSEEEINIDSASTGLSSAKMTVSGQVAVTVESWIMLCKARSDDIGKRAALSAPEAFLARLLLSSGLPRASLLAMVDRLGRLGAAAVDKDKTYHQLLQPPASSEWDIGRVGHRRDVARRLLGRISAYLRPGLVAGSASMTFVEWLAEECTANAPKPTKPKHKKSKSSKAVPPTTISKAASVLSLLQGPALTKADKNRSGDNDESMEFLEPAKTRCITADFSEAAKFIDLCFANNLTRELDDWLRVRLSSESPNVAKDVSELPVVLLQAYEKLTARPEWTTNAVSIWVPLTSRLAATRELWGLLFLSREKSKLPPTFLDGVLSRCLACWGTQNVVDCTEWIMSTGVSGLDGYAFDRLVSFLVYTSGRPPCEAESVDTSMPSESSCTWGASERFVSTAAFISLEALKKSSHPAVGIRDRNGAPNWLSLLLLLVRVGKKQLQYITQAVLRELEQTKDDGVKSALLAALLQFYLRYPLWMNVGAANVRTGLVEASEAYSDCWDNWRCSFDDQINDMLESLVNGDLKIAKSLAEFSRKHPLLILRKSSAIVAYLKADATPARQEPETVPQRGVVSGKSLDGPLKATLAVGKIVQVHLLHWGFRYTEPIWSAALDVIAAVHKEVLFGGQCLLGLQDMLGIMLNLIDVQSRLYTAGSTTKLKARLREMITMFRDSNPKCYNAWLRSQMEGEDIRNLLVRADIASAQEIIENLRAMR